MHFLSLFLALLSLSAVANDASNECVYNCPSVSFGMVKTFGSVSDLLERGTHFSFGYTPKLGFEKMNQFLESNSNSFISHLKLNLTADWIHLTGNKYDRSANYIAPMIHANWTKPIFTGRIVGSVGYGLGRLESSRTGASKNEWTSTAGLKTFYQKEMLHGLVGVGVEISSIFNKNNPINMYGSFVNYAYQF